MTWAAPGDSRGSRGLRLAAPELLGAAAVPLRRPARTPIAEYRRGSISPRRGRRGAVLVLLDGESSADPPAEQARHQDDPLATGGHGAHGVADLHRVSGLDPGAIDANVTAAARIGGG